MSGRGKKKTIGGLRQASRTQAKPNPRVITAPNVVQVPFGVPLDLKSMGVSATGIGTITLNPTPAQKPRVGVYDVMVSANSGDPLWIKSPKPMQIAVVGSDRSLTGTLTGSWTTGDTLAMPPAGLTLGEGAATYRVLAPPDGVFLHAGTIPVTIEASAAEVFAATKWTGTAKVDPGQPVITWTCPAGVKIGTVVGGPSIKVGIEPSTPVMVIVPPLNTVLAQGEVTLTASRAADADYKLATASFNVRVVGRPGGLDNPLNLATVPKQSASPNVGEMSTAQLAKAFAKKMPQQVCEELHSVDGITATTAPVGPIRSRCSMSRTTGLGGRRRRIRSA